MTNLPFRSLLVANRGEIAVRILRTCRRLGIRTIQVASTADREGLPVRLADSAVVIGPPEPRASYLDIERILDAARRTGAEAIHPGYGFLSENPEFAAAVEKAGLVFVGPPAAAIRAAGNKVAARRLMAAAGVPVVPGTGDAVADLAALREAVDRVGFPVMLKAAAGGGGRGIRLVRTAGELEAAFQRAAGEARTAFGDASVFVEKAIEDPRHIEVQILADASGGAVHLFERECSIQRRHQKLLEETPSPFLTPELRSAMGEAAVRCARAAGYVNAGTVEFLVDRDRNFWFLEMNTRLQVEHPVTEMTLGLDLVALQLAIAGGGRLPFAQDALRSRGHAIEVRVCAEDPDQGHVPAVGRVEELFLPGGPGIRVDTALCTGLPVTLWYDSLLAKLIAHGPDRASALASLRQALREFRIMGVTTNLAFLLDVVESRAFADGAYDTGFLARFGRAAPDDEAVGLAAVVAAVAAHAADAAPAPRAVTGVGGDDPWTRAARLGGLRWSGP